MKKSLFTLSIAIATILFCALGCNSNPYAGTTWRIFHEPDNGVEPYMDVITFTEKEFDYYQEDLRGNFVKMHACGTYTCKGDSIEYHPYPFFRSKTITTENGDVLIFNKGGFSQEVIFHKDTGEDE